MPTTETVTVHLSAEHVAFARKNPGAVAGAALGMLFGVFVVGPEAPPEDRAVAGAIGMLLGAGVGACLDASSPPKSLSPQLTLPI